MTVSRRVLAVGTVLAAAIVTRFADLGSRFFHHDEAIHAWFARELAVSGHYHADPVYHGPLLYHLEALVFRTVGAGELQARLLTAGFGVALIWLLYELVRREAGTRAGLIAAALAVASPTLTYYSRFNSHDVLIAVFSVVMVAMPFEYRRTGRREAVRWFAAALALAVSTKLNAWFVIGSLVAYGVCHRLWLMRQPDSSRPTHPVLGAGTVAGALAVAVSIVGVLFTTTFLYYWRSDTHSFLQAVVATGASVFVSGFKYWLGAHETERLGGPFHYYLPLLVIYELPVLLAAVGAIVFYARRRLRLAITLAVLVLAESSVALIVPAGVFELLRLQPWHLIMSTIVVLAGGSAIVSLWSTGRNWLACWVFVGVMQTLLYSLAGEKVPWLTVHVMLPWVVVSAVWLDDAWARYGGHTMLRAAGVTALLLLAVLSIRTNWIVNTRNRSNPAEPLVQIEYTPDVQTTIDAALALARRSDEPVVVRIDPAVQWPFAWYLRTARPMYGGPLTAGETAPMLIGPPDSADSALTDRYQRAELPLIHWTSWIADVNRQDFRGLIRFMIKRDRWGREGFRSFTVWTRRDQDDR